MTAFSLDDVLTIEEDEEATTQEVYVAIQRAINGAQWSLQGSYGRTMMAAIEEGMCLLGKSPCHDYWGNRIPSRDEVKAGTKGSREFVLHHMGQDWLDAIEGA